MNIFRKQVIKNGTIDYDGRPLTFDAEFCRQVAQAFRDGAHDSVPLVAADATNAHTQDVDRIRGEVIGLEATADGLEAMVRVDDERTLALLRDHPRVGVSVRVVQPLRRADGRRWTAAMQHLLITANPRLTGMTPWATVDLARATALDLPPLASPWVALTVPAAADAVELGRLDDARTALRGFARRAGQVSDVVGLLADAVRTPRPGPTAGVVERAVATINGRRAAAYVLKAVGRVRAARKSGSAPPDAFRAELPHLRAHRVAVAARADAAQRLDGLAATAGGRLRWRATLDERTTVDCRARHGSPIDLRRGPWPGPLNHANCRCTAEQIPARTDLSRSTGRITTMSTIELANQLDANQREIAALRGLLDARRGTPALPDVAPDDPYAAVRRDRHGRRLDQDERAERAPHAERAVGPLHPVSADTREFIAELRRTHPHLGWSPSALPDALPAGVGYGAEHASGQQAVRLDPLAAWRMHSPDPRAVAHRRRVHEEMAIYARRAGLV